MAIVVGNVIGSGIFLKPGGVAQQLDSVSLILLVWLVGGVLSLLGALTLAELAAMLPRAGGLYVFLREAYGPAVAFLWGWTDFFIVRPASIGALAVAFVDNVPIGGALPPVGHTVAVIALIASLAGVNVAGVIWGGRVQDLTTVLKAGFLIVIAVLPFALVRFEFAYLSPVVPASLPADFATRFGIAMLAVMWAYNGWHSVANVAEEIREPQRNLPVSLCAGVGILIVLYMTVNLAYHVVLPVEEMARHGEQAAVAVADRLMGSTGARLIGVVILVSTFGALNCNLLVYPRIYFAMARDGIFFRRLARVHPRYHTPAGAIIAQTVLASAAVLLARLEVHVLVAGWFRDLGWVKPAAYDAFAKASVFDLLTNLVIFGASIFYTLAVASVIVLRRRRPDLERPYRTYGYPWVPAAFVVSYIWFLWRIFDGERAGALVGIAMILTGLPAYAVWRARRSTE
jgi:APA family basic amino acid/polyamine antiporter